MKQTILSICLLCLTVFSTNAFAVPGGHSRTKLFKPDNRNIQYTGRIDFSNPQKPRFWSAGVYFTFRFKGPSCQVIIGDEVKYGNNHNYLEVIVDHNKPYRIQTTGKVNHITIGKGLDDGIHTVTICKDTESLMGYCELLGIRCGKLLPPPAAPERKMEFIGNSITSGTGSDLRKVPCGKGQWYDQQNAYMSYGPLTARMLDSRWILSSVSGIGMIHSCCNMTITMPPVYDKTDLSDDSIAWNFSRYQPDIVTICLGQNDGIQDSVKFCGAYVRFIRKLRGYYPDAHIICLSSPMANQKLTAVLKSYLSGVVNYLHSHGDKNVYKFFFPRSYNKGCGGHPDMAQHQVIARELAGYIKSEFGW